MALADSANGRIEDDSRLPRVGGDALSEPPRLERRLLRPAMECRGICPRGAFVPELGAAALTCSIRSGEHILDVGCGNETLSEQCRARGERRRDRQ